MNARIIERSAVLNQKPFQSHFAGNILPIVPKPPSCLVVAGISLTSVHADPFQVSVIPVELGLSPQNTKPEVVVPAPAACLLAVISAISVQQVPFHCSVSVSYTHLTLPTN